MANSNDLPDKMKELVVEENANETNWNNLPFEMKEMVVKVMDLETRTRLKLCSKSDKYLVESIRMSFNKLDVYVREEDEELKVDLKLYRDKDQKKPILHIKIRPNDRIVVIKNPEKYDRAIVCSSSENAKNMVKQMFASIVYKSNLRFDRVEMIIDYPDFVESTELKMHAPNSILVVSSAVQVTQLLNNVTPRVKDVHVNTLNGEEFEGIGNIPVIVNAEILRVFCECDINDEQLLTFNCTYLRIESNITGKGMNQMIKKALSNDYPKETEIKSYIGWDTESQYWNDVIDGLDINVKNSNDRTDENGQVKLVYRNGYIEMNHGKWLEVYLSAGDDYEPDLVGFRIF